MYNAWKGTVRGRKEGKVEDLLKRDEKQVTGVQWIHQNRKGGKVKGLECMEKFNTRRGKKGRKGG